MTQALRPPGRGCLQSRACCWGPRGLTTLPLLEISLPVSQAGEPRTMGLRHSYGKEGPTRAWGGRRDRPLPVITRAPSDTRAGRLGRGRHVHLAWPLGEEVERPPVEGGAREGRRAWRPVGGQEGVGITTQQGVSHPSWLGWWGWVDDAQRPLGGEACLWSRAPRNWAGLGRPAQAWGSTWEPQREWYCQKLAPGQSHRHTGSSQSSWRSGCVPLEGWTRGCLEPGAGRGGPGFLWRSWEQGVGSPLGGRAGLWGLEVRGEPSPGAVGSPSFGAPFGSPSEQGCACPRPPQVGPGAALPCVQLCGGCRAPGRTVTLCL